MESLTPLLAEARAQYISKNPASQSAYQSRLESLPRGNTRSVLHYDPFPMTFVSGDGVRVTSVDGKEYCDFLGEYSASLFGHNDTRIREAIKGALLKGLTLGAPNQDEDIVARKLCERFNFHRVRMTNSGTEANVIALGLAKHITGRSKILVFENGYHGSVLSFTAAGNPLNLPLDYIIAPFNNVEEVDRVLASLPRDSLAAILIEPMQGASGYTKATASFLSRLRAWATDLGSVLIFDEVQTSRLGWRGLGVSMGVAPDIMTLGKYLGGGCPFGAFGGVKGTVLGEKAMKAFEGPQGIIHAGTFNNNVLTMAAAVAAAEILSEQNLVSLNTLGAKVREQLNFAIRSHDMEDVVYVQGEGSLLAFNWKRHIPGGGELLWFWCEAHGVYISPRGSIALMFPHTQEDLERLVHVIEGFLFRYRGCL